MFNKNLPIYEYGSKILDTVYNNNVTIITAETGSGKSTQVPQMLLSVGYTILVTQPRRIAAKRIAERVAEEYGVTLGDVIGYKTGDGELLSYDTQCLFTTDGIGAVKVLTSSNSYDVLIIDEVHEFNINIEILLAWYKKELMETGIKLVIMSASIDASNLSEFFNNAPIIDIPGRLFSIEDREPTGTLEEEAVKLIQEKRSLMVFQPGKDEVNKSVSLIKEICEESEIDAVVLPLYSEMLDDEQKLCFKTYDKPKVIVCTNIGQTSITIEGINAVVDSGIERRIEVDLISGIEELVYGTISLDARTQRRGRCGRTEPGIYVDMCDVPIEERSNYSKPEIFRVILNQTVLRFASFNTDISDIELFHQPDKDLILEAKKTLKSLKCMDENDNVTQLGKKVNRLPVAVNYAIMIVKAYELGVIDEVITIAAILKAGEITKKPGKGVKDFVPRWTELCPYEKDSDLIAQMEIYNAGLDLNGKEKFEYGIIGKQHHKVKGIRKKILDKVENIFGKKIKQTDKQYTDFKKRVCSTDSVKRNIIKSILYGMIHHVYYSQTTIGNVFVDDKGNSRYLNRQSVIKNPGWVIGVPFDLQLPNNTTLNLLNLATKIDVEMLEEVAPHLLTVVNEHYEYNGFSDKVTCYSNTYFKDHLIKRTGNNEVTDEEIINEHLAKYLTDCTLGKYLPNKKYKTLIEDNQSKIAEGLDLIISQSSEEKVLFDFYLSRIRESKRYKGGEVNLAFLNMYSSLETLIKDSNENKKLLTSVAYKSDNDILETADKLKNEKDKFFEPVTENEVFNQEKVNQAIEDLFPKLVKKPETKTLGNVKVITKPKKKQIETPEVTNLFTQSVIDQLSSKFKVVENKKKQQVSK